MPGHDRDLLIIRDASGRELGRLSVPSYPHRNTLTVHVDHDEEPALVLDFGQVGTRYKTINVFRPNPDGTRTSTDGVMVT